MRYVTIGSGSAVPQRDRSAPCHLVQIGGKTIVVDLGPGSLWGLLRHGRVSPADIDLLLLTHLHMDHCADLAPLLFALRSPEVVRVEPLLVVGPEGLNQHYHILQMLWDHSVRPTGFDLTISEWKGERLSMQGCFADAAPTLHSMDNLAWRIDPGTDGGCGIVITGDGRATDELITLAGSAQHVLVAESAAGPGELLGGHMNPAQAGELASMCGSNKLILSHINPGQGSDVILKEAAAHFHGEIVVAEDGLEIEVD